MQAWSPYRKKDTEILQRIQHTATKIIKRYIEEKIKRGKTDVRNDNGCLQTIHERHINKEPFTEGGACVYQGCPVEACLTSSRNSSASGPVIAAVVICYIDTGFNYGAISEGPNFLPLHWVGAQEMPHMQALRGPKLFRPARPGPFRCLCTSWISTTIFPNH